MTGRPLTPLKRVLLADPRPQYVIAHEVGISEAHLSRISNGLHVSDDLIEKITAALGREKADLWPHLFGADPERRAA